MEVSFYPIDTYATAKLKFNAAWPNLKLEVNYDSVKFSYEGWDLIAEDSAFIDTGNSEVPVFTLTDAMHAYDAAHLFSKHFNGKAFISRTGPIIGENETLAFANDPFVLPLNKYTYDSYRMRFKRRWPNLSVRLYDVSQGKAELTDDVSMKNRKGKMTTLNDYVVISGWQKALQNIHLTATIINKKISLTWDSTMRPLCLKEFHEIEKREDSF